MVDGRSIELDGKRIFNWIGEYGRVAGVSLSLSVDNMQLNLPESLHLSLVWKQQRVKQV